MIVPGGSNIKLQVRDPIVSATGLEGQAKRRMMVKI